MRRSDQRSTRHLLVVASLAGALLLANVDNGHAGGPYDGEWSGSATVVKDGRCKAANVTLTIRNNEAAGQAKFDLESRSIVGTVLPDGTLGATIGFQHLTGTFRDDRFEGAFQSFECAWTVSLRRSTARPLAVVMR